MGTYSVRTQETSVVSMSKFTPAIVCPHLCPSSLYLLSGEGKDGWQWVAYFEPPPNGKSPPCPRRGD